MKVYMHQTHHTIADLDAIFEDLKDKLSKSDSGLHIFPELYLTGYPLQDLCLQRPFIERYLEKMEELGKWLKNSKQNFGHALVGGLNYIFKEDLPEKIENAVFILSPGEEPKQVYTKILLPNYDIFDEQKYFHSGEAPCLLEIDGKKVGVLICEDMWMSSVHSTDPVKMLKNHSDKQKIQPDLIVNLSASPFHLNKHPSRLERVEEISKTFGAPMAYINRVGGEDEILFDGRSFCLYGSQRISQAAIFEEQTICFDLNDYPKFEPESIKEDLKNTWESLFSPTFNQSSPPQLPRLSDNDCNILVEALGFGITEYARKSGFKKIMIALSGGIDSALVLAIAYHTLPKDWKLEALYMPSQYSATMSYDLSEQMCSNLNIPFRNYPIKFLHAAIRNGFQDSFGEPLTGLSDENIQSRLRGALLYARSNQSGAMVLNTSNKSELAVGYSTQYGDSVGAISVLGDLYKSEVFQLAQFINRTLGPTIPNGIIDRPPSAELRADQKDSDSLPPYEILDGILEGVLSYRLSPKTLVKMGYPEGDVEKVYRLYLKTEYKRTQFCPIIKIKAKSFGFGYRIPINKKMI